MRDFVSNLAGKLNDLLDYKHALGIKYDTCRVSLLELDGDALQELDTANKGVWAIFAEHRRQGCVCSG